MWQQNCDDKNWNIYINRFKKKNTMKYFRPLSESMLQKLKNCRQSELKAIRERPFHYGRYELCGCPSV